MVAESVALMNFLRRTDVLIMYDSHIFQMYGVSHFIRFSIRIEVVVEVDKFRTTVKIFLKRTRISVP